MFGLPMTTSRLAAKEIKMPSLYPPAIVPWRTVHQLTGLSRVTVWRLRAAGQFPQPVRLAPNRVG